VKIVCVLSEILGNAVISSRVREVVQQLENVDPEFVSVAPGDFRDAATPWWARLTNPWESQYVARHKMAGRKSHRMDLLIVTSWEYAVAFRGAAQTLPSAVFLDATPSTMDLQMRQRGYTSWKRDVAQWIHNRSFRRAAGAFDLFLAAGSDCRDALHADYGVSLDRILVTLAPQNLQEWKPGGARKSTGGRMRLLFVGNDFRRKGGDFLIRLYREHLADFCELTIASNDPVLAETVLPEGVTWLAKKTRGELLQVYQDSQVFLLPTQQDFMPQVLGEALACGLPCIANDVGGIRDLVRTGETGYLMDRTAGAESWVKYIKELHLNPAQLRFADNHKN